MTQKGVTVPGFPSGDRGSWEKESLPDRSHACFAKKAYERWKIKFRAFPKRVGPRILSLESVDYFGTSEHCWVAGKKKILISKTAMVGCCKLSLYANGLVMSMRFIFGNNAPWKSLFDLWQWCNFSGIEALRPQTYFPSSLTRVLNQFRNK